MSDKVYPVLHFHSYFIPQGGGKKYKNKNIRKTELVVTDIVDGEEQQFLYEVVQKHDEKDVKSLGQWFAVKKAIKDRYHSLQDKYKILSVFKHHSVDVHNLIIYEVFILQDLLEQKGLLDRQYD